MSNTYQSFYVNEDRALEITINDQYGNAFIPSAAWIQVKTDKGVTVIAEQPAMVLDNRVMTIIGTTVTSNPGKYIIIWRIVYASRFYYHVTELEIQEIY